MGSTVTQGTVGWPDGFDPEAVEALTAQVARVAGGLEAASSALGDATTSTTASWEGSAAQAFRNHLGGRVQSLGDVAAQLRGVVPVLQTYVEATKNSLDGYVAGVDNQRAAIASSSDSEEQCAIGQQADAVEALQSAGAACAAQLRMITAALPTSFVSVGASSTTANRSTTARIGTVAVSTSTVGGLALAAVSVSARVGGSLGAGAGLSAGSSQAAVLAAYGQTPSSFTALLASDSTPTGSTSGKLWSTDVSPDPYLANFQKKFAELHGVDLDTWNPASTAAQNKEKIYSVYGGYGDEFLHHPYLEWAGMANVAGATFAAAFAELDDAEGLIAKLDVILLANGQPILFTPADIAYFRTTFQKMQKAIFLDMGGQIEAYNTGGIKAIKTLRAHGDIDDKALLGWELIDDGRRTGNKTQLADGNELLLSREQNQIIDGYYNSMRAYDWPKGQIFTEGMTRAAGAPDIPGAKSPNQAWVWNISDRTERWNLISNDTFPKYAAAVNDGTIARTVQQPFDDRVQQQTEGLGQLIHYLDHPSLPPLPLVR